MHSLYRDSNTINLLCFYGTVEAIRSFHHVSILSCNIGVQLSIFPHFPLSLQRFIQLYHPIGLFRNRSSCISVRIQNSSNATPVSILITIVEHYSIVHNVLL
jgi:hypothetical protein